MAWFEALLMYCISTKHTQINVLALHSAGMSMSVLTMECTGNASHTLPTTEQGTDKNTDHRKTAIVLI